MSQKSGFLIVLNGFFIENVGHTWTKNYNGTYWPLDKFERLYLLTYATHYNGSHTISYQHTMNFQSLTLDF